jgi:class 3 adenylate cyclase/DNA-binding response OmpR family regulator
MGGGVDDIRERRCLNSVLMESSIASQAPQPKTVLVVDDSNIMRRLVSEIVGMDPDFKVVDTAENGKIALQKVRLWKPDVILLDIEMPELSGLETLRRLGLRSPSKVVILSSLGGEGTAERAEALRLGAAEVLDKPSGSVSMDIKSARGSAVLKALRRVTGLPIEEEEASPLDLPAGIDAAGLSLHVKGQATMLNFVRIAMLGFSPEGTLVYHNAAAHKIVEPNRLNNGLSTLGELFGDYNVQLAEDISSVLKSGEPKLNLDVDFATESGSWLPLTVSIQPVPSQLHEYAGVFVSLEDTSREQSLRQVLDKVMSSAVTEAVVGGEDMQLGGKLADATVLFCDVRGFTKLCEGLDAESVVRMMNEYFAFMADVIRGKGGVIDKYIGDAIMALFGVPKSGGNDADNAVGAGFAMLQALDILNEDRLRAGSVPFKIGIGLATGKVVAGLLGSPERMNYTVMGNSVNLAARIESLTSYYGAQLLVCSDTFSSLHKSYRSRLLDKIRVKGQQTPAALYEILYSNPPEQESEWLSAYSQGLSAYESGKFMDAKQLFQKALLFNSNDTAAQVLLARCEYLLEHPDPEWDGVWSMASKSG